MKPHLLTQITFSAFIALALAGFTFLQWRELQFWGFLDEVSIKQQAEFAKRLTKDAIPKSFGNWEFVQFDPVNEKEIRLAGITSVVQAVYKNLNTNEHLSIFVATGPTNEICIHTPEQCYPGHGADTSHQPTAMKVYNDDNKLVAEFLNQTYHQDVNGVKVSREVWWGFSADGTWEGPRNPRSHYFSSRAMYKIYLTRAFDETTVPTAQEKLPQQDFLAAFIPELNKVLFVQSPTATSGEDGNQPSDKDKTNPEKGASSDKVG
ncbi:MAG: exosortase-associated EpsI family protein [Pirellulales bacterium]|nr:exosortase-associated EpsI family protein [Pirellulales bacterium]